MKKNLILTTLTLLMSFNAFAGGYKFICKQTDAEPGSDRISFIMTQIGNDELSEDHKMRFKAELFTNYSKAPIFSRVVTATNEDVQLFFEDKERELVGTFYLDEGQQSLTFKGKNIYLNCDY